MGSSRTPAKRVIATIGCVSTASVRKEIVMDKIVIQHNGQLFNCWYRAMTWQLAPRPEACPLCDKPVVKGDAVYLFITNYLLFPNVTCHAKCTGPVNKKVVKRLLDSYLKAKKAIESARSWFPYIFWVPDREE